MKKIWDFFKFDLKFIKFKVYKSSKNSTKNILLKKVVNYNNQLTVCVN